MSPQLVRITMFWNVFILTFRLIIVGENYESRKFNPGIGSDYIGPLRISVAYGGIPDGYSCSGKSTEWNSD